MVVRDVLAVLCQRRLAEYCFAHNLRQKLGALHCADGGADDGGAVGGGGARGKHAHEIHSIVKLNSRVRLPPSCSCPNPRRCDVGSTLPRPRRAWFEVCTAVLLL